MKLLNIILMLVCFIFFLTPLTGQYDTILANLGIINYSTDDQKSCEGEKETDYFKSTKMIYRDTLLLLNAKNPENEIGLRDHRYKRKSRYQYKN